MYIVVRESIKMIDFHGTLRTLFFGILFHLVKDIISQMI